VSKKPSWFDPSCEKTLREKKNQEGFIADIEKKLESLKKPVGLTLREKKPSVRKKPRRFHFRLSKKISTSKKPSWFDPCEKKTKKVSLQTLKKNKSVEKTFLV
jgi:hypothetical protein